MRGNHISCLKTHLFTDCILASGPPGTFHTTILEMAENITVDPTQLTVMCNQIKCNELNHMLFKSQSKSKV